jgi:hypothetical protein
LDRGWGLTAPSRNKLTWDSVLEKPTAIGSHTYSTSKQVLVEFMAGWSAAAFFFQRSLLKKDE